jgi:choline dehydrogenase-like flavoprotein
LNEYEAVGPKEIVQQLLVRNRAPGGNSQLWMGKVAAFDESDYARRDWISESGWPIDRGEIDAWLDRAACVLNLGPNIYNEKLWNLMNMASPIADFDASLLRSVFWQFSKSRHRASEVMRFGDQARSMSAANLRLIVGATVVHVNTNPEGTRFESVVVHSLSGARATLRARMVVLCAGGIENARILLASNRIVCSGLGNEKDQVGRHLTHLRCGLGEFERRDFARVEEMLGFFLLASNGTRYPYLHGLNLSPAVQRREKLLNAAAFVTEHRSATDPWDILKRLVRRQSPRPMVDAATVLAQPMTLASGAYRRFVQKRGLLHKIEKLRLDAFIEQVPDPDRRITLGSRTDPLGMPIPKVIWGFSEQETRTAVRLGQIIVDEFARAGLIRISLADWVREHNVRAPTFETVAHPTGTTRMSASPQNGVVNRDCRLHGVHGVYLAGTSVFPTAGHANPTLMVVALALRLANQLKWELAR